MCKCSYVVKKEHPNKPVESPIHPFDSQQQQQQQRQPNVKDLIFSSPWEGRVATTLITNYDYSSKSEAAPSTPSKLSMIKRGKLKRRVTIGSNQASLVVDASSDGGAGGGGGGGEEAEWPPFADEDYIVFCFEEDGEFHVVMEENSRSQEASEHGYSDGSPRPHNLKVEEERFYFSPRLQSDGIRSSTRFKQEVRGRVDEDMECKGMDEIKSRGQLDEDQEDSIEDDEEDLEFRDTSTECVRGSPESMGSNQSDWEQTLQLTDADQETQHVQISTQEANHVTSPSYIKDNLLSKKMVDEEESVYLSSESQQGGSQDDDELSNNDEQLGRGSAETSDSSRSEITEEEQCGAEEESAQPSDISSKSSEESDRISSSSFEFPELQWEWIGSPDIWPKSETTQSIQFRKHKSRSVCLRLCRF